MYNTYKNRVSCCVANLIAVVTLAVGVVYFTTSNQQATFVKGITWTGSWPVSGFYKQNKYIDESPIQLFSVARQRLEPEELPKAIVYRTQEKIDLSERERNCLLRNVFFESGAEPYEGKIAVAQVTWNRLKSGVWGKDLCRVVYAPSQFSWTADRNKRNRPISGDRYQHVVSAVDDFIAGTRITRLDTAMHFHATYVNPNWAKSDLRIKQIGGHVFYALK